MHRYIVQLMLHCSLLWTSCLRFLTKSPVIPQQLYKTASHGLSWIAELLVFFCRWWSDLDKILRTGAEWHVDYGDVVKIETRCRIPIRRTFGLIPWHVIPEPPANCRVLPLGEFTVMIPEPHARLQGAVTWRNQCHDCATLQGVIIPPVILKIVFRHILVIFLVF